MIKKKRTAIDILAIGGRYDKLVHNYSYLKVDSNAESKLNQVHAVGVSIAIEKVCIFCCSP